MDRRLAKMTWRNTRDPPERPGEVRVVGITRGEGDVDDLGPSIAQHSARGLEASLID